MKKRNCNNRILGVLSAFEIDNKSLIALDKKWNDFFIGDNLIFEVRIDKNEHFVLVGPQVKLQPTKRNLHYSKEVPMNENNL